MVYLMGNSCILPLEAKRTEGMISADLRLQVVLWRQVVVRGAYRQSCCCDGCVASAPNLQLAQDGNVSGGQAADPDLAPQHILEGHTRLLR